MIQLLAVWEREGNAVFLPHTFRDEEAMAEITRNISKGWSLLLAWRVLEPVSELHHLCDRLAGDDDPETLPIDLIATRPDLWQRFEKKCCKGMSKSL
jgi:hypothetical protein